MGGFLESQEYGIALSAAYDMPGMEQAAIAPLLQG
jgi:hypothetical protein